MCVWEISSLLYEREQLSRVGSAEAGASPVLRYIAHYSQVHSSMVFWLKCSSETWPFFSFAFPRLGQQQKVGVFESPSCGGGFIVEGRDKPPPAALFCSERGEQRGQHPSVSAPALLGSCSLSSLQGKMSSLHDTGSPSKSDPG